jgi:hypothetical protein
LNEPLNPAAAAAYFLAKAHCRRIVVGPLVFRPCEGPSETFTVLAVGTGDEAKRYHCDLLFLLDADGRAALIRAMAKPGITLHLMKSELDMARKCEELWPCEKSRSARCRVEEEGTCSFTT